MEDDEDVPPLEDMCEAFSTCLQVRGQNLTAQNAPKREVLEVVEDVQQLKVKRIEKLLDKSEAPSELKEDETETDTRSSTTSSINTKKDISTDIKKTDNFCGFKKGFFDSAPKKTPQKSDKDKENAQKRENDSTGNFGGFKKGFFNSPKGQNRNVESTKLTESKSKEKVIEDVPVVRKKVETNKNVFPEVQSAMKEQVPFLKSDKWLTDDLLSRIMSHPKLSKQFTDPRFSEAIQLFSTKPGEVMNMCKSNPELKEFVQEFCSLMGNHFAALGEKEEQETRTSSSSTKTSSSSSSSSSSPSSPPEKQHVPHADDERRVQGLMTDPEISSILQTPEVQRLLQVLKEEPDKAEKILSSADASLRRKIQKLVDVGILQMAV